MAAPIGLLSSATEVARAAMRASELELRSNSLAAAVEANRYRDQLEVILTIPVIYALFKLADDLRHIVRDHDELLQALPEHQRALLALGIVSVEGEINAAARDRHHNYDCTSKEGHIGPCVR